MKRVILILPLVLFFVRCDNQESVLPIDSTAPTFEQISGIHFKITPLSENELKVNWLPPGSQYSP